MKLSQEYILEKSGFYMQVLYHEYNEMLRFNMVRVLLVMLKLVAISFLGWNFFFGKTGWDGKNNNRKAISDKNWGKIKQMSP